MPQHDVLVSERFIWRDEQAQIRIRTGAHALRVLWKIHLIQGWLLPFGATLTTSLNIRCIYCKGASGPSCDGVHKRLFVLSSVVQFLELHQRKRWFWQSQEAAQEKPGLPCSRKDLRPGGIAAAIPRLEISSFPLNANAYFEGKYIMVFNVCITTVQHF